MVSSSNLPVIVHARELRERLRATRRAALSDCSFLAGEAQRNKLAQLLSTLSAENLNESMQGFPTPVQELAQDFVALTEELTQLWREHEVTLTQALTDRARALRGSVNLRRAELADRERLLRAEGTIARAAATGRELTPGELNRVRALREAKSAFEVNTSHLPDDVDRDEVMHGYGVLRLREARQQLRSGLLLTEQMRRVEREAVSALHRGEPVLLIGETGGAKTALAEHLSRLITNTEPELVSGYGDITSAQVIGTHQLRSDAGTPVTEFAPGPLLRAMTEGHPVILDEINAMPAEFLKRLNRILQLRPGDQFRVQENAGALVRVQPGFVVLATANELSSRRYRGIEQLSSELVNRFGAHTFRVHYPDVDVPFTGVPRENLLLASAAAVDREGRLRGMSEDELERFARVAFISQRVFSGSQEAGFRDFVSTERTIDGRPGLEESVLAPRTMVALVSKVASSAGALTVNDAVARFVEGIMHREDRAVLTLICQGQGFFV